MLEIQTIDDLKQHIQSYKKQHKTIGFVPTMGNLHAGHLSLIDIARKQCDIVVASIFVNPLQFGINEDLDAYPRTLEQDLKHLDNHQCDLVFFPKNEELLKENTTRVTVPVLREGMEGDMREGHLDGVATIVTMLFNLVQPDVACFGKKDYQQWLMIKKMVEDLNLDINVIGGETVREETGLAMSSRNQYMSTQEKTKAPLFRQALLKLSETIKNTEPQKAIENTKQELLELGFTIDYLELRQQQTLAKTNDINHAVLVSTVRLGTTRLLDNLELN